MQIAFQFDISKKFALIIVIVQELLWLCDELLYVSYKHITT